MGCMAVGARQIQRTIHLANDAVLNHSEGGLGGPETSQHLLHLVMAMGRNSRDWQLAVFGMLKLWTGEGVWVQQPLRQDVLTATKTCKRLDAGVQAFTEGLKRKQAVRRKCQEIW